MKNAIKRTVTLQIGVDVLGFPIYVVHQIYQDNPAHTQKQGNTRRLKWLTVIEKLIKQH